VNINAEITWTGDEFLRAWEKAIPSGLNAAAEVLESEVVDGFGQDHGGKASASGGFPNSQRGVLRNSIQVQRAENALDSAYVGTEVPYGRYLHYGAHIRSRSGGAIVIPLNDEARRMMEQHGGRARSVINALKFDRQRPIFFAKTKSGLLVLRSLGRTRHGPAEPFLLITKQAIIKARPWGTLGPARAGPKMESAFVATASAKMAAAGGVA
jgi:hypothetical protein